MERDLDIILIDSLFCLITASIGIIQTLAIDLSGFLDLGRFAPTTSEYPDAVFEIVGTGWFEILRRNLEINSECKTRRAPIRHLAQAATYTAPNTLAADVFLSEDFRQIITPTNSMQEQECIADIALARCIGANEDGQRTQCERRVPEVLKILKVQ